MKRIIPVVRVSKETLEVLIKSRAGLVQKRVWVKDSAKGHKGHWRMQWVHPENGKADASEGQLDLFGNTEGSTPAKNKEGEFNVAGDVRSMSDEAIVSEKEKLLPQWQKVQKLLADKKSYTDGTWRYQEAHEKVMPHKDFKRFNDLMDEQRRRLENPSKPLDETGKTDEYKPAHPELGEFVGHGLSDNGRGYEGYAGKDGSVKYYDTKTGKELDDDGNVIESKESKKGSANKKIKQSVGTIMFGSLGEPVKDFVGATGLKTRDGKEVRVGYNSRTGEYVVTVGTNKAYSGPDKNEAAYTLNGLKVQWPKYDDEPAQKKFQAPKNVEMEDLSKFGKVNITDIGDENVYFTKDENEYFFKPSRTGDYKKGVFDFRTMKKSVMESFRDSLSKAFGAYRG